jgi:hypothetical protein
MDERASIKKPKAQAEQFIKARFALAEQFFFQSRVDFDA